MAHHVTVTLTETQAVRVLVALDYFLDSMDCLNPTDIRTIRATERAIETARTSAG